MRQDTKKYIKKLITGLIHAAHILKGTEVTCKDPSDVHPYDVYQEVWAMDGGIIMKYKVFAVISAMNYYKNGIEYSYRLVHSAYGAGWGNYPGKIFSKSEVFPNKEQLVRGLCNE